MEIEILHIEGCPNWRDTADHVTESIAELGATQPPVRVTLLSSPAAAARVPFAGAPSTEDLRAVTSSALERARDR